MNIIQFSGGKDSLATLLLMKESLENYEVVFCDTRWEHEKTYQHIKDVQKKVNKNFIVLRSKIFRSFIDMVKKKLRFPSTKARFCTEELKMKPMIDFIIELKEDVNIYQGIRGDESTNRSKMNSNDDYFKFYFEPYGYDKHGKPKYHTYRKKQVFKYCDKYDAAVIRPIFEWDAEEVFKFIHSKGFKANPLYYEGFKRVGCFPCINCTQPEAKQIFERYPETFNELEVIENSLNTTFFPILYIPERFCSKPVTRKGGEPGKAPTISDVKKYLDTKQIPLFTKSTCESIYNICE